MGPGTFLYYLDLKIKGLLGTEAVFSGDYSNYDALAKECSGGGTRLPSPSSAISSILTRMGY